MKMIMLLDLAQNRKLGLTEIAKNKENEIDENDKIKKRFSTIYIAKYGGKIKPNFDASHFYLIANQHSLLNSLLYGFRFPSSLLEDCGS